jgi:hypothetical protein
MVDIGITSNDFHLFDALFLPGPRAPLQRGQQFLDAFGHSLMQRHAVSLPHPAKGRMILTILSTVPEGPPLLMFIYFYCADPVHHFSAGS